MPIKLHQTGKKHDTFNWMWLGYSCRYLWTRSRKFTIHSG